jgi:hypothetical protein
MQGVATWFVVPGAVTLNTVRVPDTRCYWQHLHLTGNWGVRGDKADVNVHQILFPAPSLNIKGHMDLMALDTQLRKCMRGVTNVVHLHCYRSYTCSSRLLADVAVLLIV